MLRSLPLLRWFVTALVLLTSLACSDDRQADQHLEKGRLALPLQSTTATGVTYRLRDALFTVTRQTGNTATLVRTNDVPVVNEVKLNLEVGRYDVELSSEVAGFRMDRVNANGSTTPAENVELVSAAVVSLEVENEREARAVFRFLVDGVPVGFGDLIISIEIEERRRDGGADDLDGGAEETDAGADAGDAGEPVCGDGVVNQVIEDCDDGNDDNDDECSNDCVIACVCGDLIVCPWEDCDDGNLVDGDACPASCLFEAEPACGDGVVNQPSEQCDDGNDVDDDECPNDCQLGDGGVTEPEPDPGEPEPDPGDPNPDCIDCLDTNVPDNLNQNCTANTACADVRKCVVDSNCFQTGGSPSICYCGTGATIDECLEQAFVPQGPCVDEIRAAFEADGLSLDNATVVDQLAAITTTSGQAFSILIPATNFGICIDECSL